MTDFTQSFQSFLTAAPRISPDISPDFFLGNIYSKNESIHESLPHILSGGALEASFPYSFQLAPLNCFLLLYTENGYGKLHTESGIHSLESGTFLFLNCNQPFKIEIAISPWKYKVFFIRGTILDYYYSLLTNDSFPLFMLPGYSPIIRNLEKLVLSSQSSSFHSKLYDSRLLTDIISDLLLENMENEDWETKIPSYLTEMKALFDMDYQKTYTLDELEDYFSISKYRLCREFHQYFGESPLKYLNAKRIDIAADLLLTTDYRIHEIGSLVGVDNTNHFICLFKKRMGMTPFLYRKK